MFLNCLFVGCGGFVGSVLRYLCSLLQLEQVPLPVITLGINILGSFAIILLSGVAVDALGLSERWSLFLRVGLCGGFTTFSTFSAETLALLEQGDTMLALSYAVLSCVLCVGAAFLGHCACSWLAA